MAVRAWQNDDSELRVPITSESMVADNVLLGCLIKPSDKDAYEVIMIGCDAAGDDQWTFGTNPSNQPFFFITNGSQTDLPSTGGALTDGSQYALFYTKQGTGGARRFHVYSFATGTTTHIAGDMAGGANTPTSTAGGFIRFGSSGGSDDLNARMALAGISVTVPSTLEGQDALVEALVANLSSNDWLGLGGAWNFDQTTNTDDVPDLTGNHITISGTISGGTDPNGITGTTIVTGEDPAGWDFTTTPPAINWSYRFSGGASNDDPAESLGGAESSEEIETALLADVGRSDAVTGLTRYVGLYVHNDSDNQPATVKAWFSELSLSSGVAVTMGAAVEAAGATMATVASSSTAPSGVTFTTPFTAEDAIDLGTIDGGEGKGLWVRMIVDPNSAGALHNGWNVQTDDVPL